MAYDLPFSDGEVDITYTQTVQPVIREFSNFLLILLLGDEDKADNSRAVQQTFQILLGI
jgi:hypothetical protein